jgi:ligand-binding SRPBCC domain-containing protein
LRLTDSNRKTEQNFERQRLFLLILDMPEKNIVPNIRIGRAADGSGFRLESEQFLPQPLETVFAFFSDAYQLEKLTPPWLHFSVLTPAPIPMKQGTLIDYRLKLHGIPMKWQSRIEVWEPPVRFVDLQTRGPYRWWHHEHRFEATAGGTICRDIVDYAVPGGSLVERWFVRPDILKIFSFRWNKLRELFPAKISQSFNPLARTS